MSTTDINIPFPESGDLHLSIAVGACRLMVKPGGDAWISGKYEDPSNSLPCKIVQDGGSVLIRQDYNAAELFGLFSGAPSLELALGKTKPFAMTIESGASDNTFDLGGVPIRRLEVKCGANKSSLDFSSPNPEQMSVFEIGAGAGALDIKHLANANSAEIRIEGGMAAYTFDFGGALRREVHCKITTGVSSVELSIPGATAAKIAVESVMGNLHIGDGYTKREGAFWTEGAVAGTSPVIFIQASVALGALRLLAY